jgi:hypothetical protein
MSSALSVADCEVSFTASHILKFCLAPEGMANSVITLNKSDFVFIDYS